MGKGRFERPEPGKWRPIDRYKPSGPARVNGRRGGIRAGRATPSAGAPCPLVPSGSPTAPEITPNKPPPTPGQCRRLARLFGLGPLSEPPSPVSRPSDIGVCIAAEASGAADPSSQSNSVSTIERRLPFLSRSFSQRGQPIYRKDRLIAGVRRSPSSCRPKRRRGAAGRLPGDAIDLGGADRSVTFATRAILPRRPAPLRNRRPRDLADSSGAITGLSSPRDRRRKRGRTDRHAARLVRRCAFATGVARENGAKGQPGGIPAQLPPAQRGARSRMDARQTIGPPPVNFLLDPIPITAF
jgi:hypothetical protein